MMKAERRPSKAWERKCVARWRLLSAQGLDLQVAAAEIGVSANDLAVWSRGSSSAPMLIPVCIKDEAEQRSRVSRSPRSRVSRPNSPGSGSRVSRPNSPGPGSRGVEGPARPMHSPHSPGLKSLHVAPIPVSSLVIPVFVDAPEPVVTCAPVLVVAGVGSGCSS